MAVPLNQEIGSRLEELAVLLAKQGANHFRVAAYRRAGKTLSTLPQPVSEIYRRDGLAGLEQLPGVGETIAHAIRDLLLHGRLGMLDRLRGEHDPIALLRTVPAIGKTLAWRLHEGLGIDSLSDLQAAAYDGRLETFPGLGPKRLTGIRASLALRLGRIRSAVSQEPPAGRRTAGRRPRIPGLRFHRDAAEDSPAQARSLRG